MPFFYLENSETKGNTGAGCGGSYLCCYEAEAGSLLGQGHLGYRVRPRALSQKQA